MTTQGEDVPLSALRQVWENHTVPGALVPSTTIPEVYRTVREINSSLPRERQLRVLLGDPPIDWDAVIQDGRIVAHSEGTMAAPADGGSVRCGLVSGAAGAAGANVVHARHVCGSRVSRRTAASIETGRTSGLGRSPEAILRWPQPTVTARESRPFTV